MHGHFSHGKDRSYACDRVIWPPRVHAKPIRTHLIVGSHKTVAQGRASSVAMLAKKHVAAYLDCSLSKGVPFLFLDSQWQIVIRHALSLLVKPGLTAD